MLTCRTGTALRAGTQRRCVFQFCEILSAPEVSRWAGPIIDVLLDYVGNVQLCARLKEHIDSFEDWAVIKEKAAGWWPIIQALPAVPAEGFAGGQLGSGVCAASWGGLARPGESLLDFMERTWPARRARPAQPVRQLTLSHGHLPGEVRLSSGFADGQSVGRITDWPQPLPSRCCRRCPQAGCWPVAVAQSPRSRCAGPAVPLPDPEPLGTQASTGLVAFPVAWASWSQI
ncbi:Ankyrin repeat and SOCS box protein 2 [Galemys pyrenaicus]|uniref:Ankyrin repeat and SOCS box protein 2 n=1 Tax=Galemys pyrenaicus TaxID=202257 RepID=A0A8J6DN69_GALPY|nr:Ankyrin repeat and SOCS box protein 2 [Galemys pyrenaicus]